MFPVLPDPEDIHPSPLRPSKRKHGWYELHREAYETAIEVIEPNGDSYMMEFFEFERFLKSVLKIEEVIANRISDTVWNFNRARFHTEEPEVILNRKDPSWFKST